MFNMCFSANLTEKSSTSTHFDKIKKYIKNIINKSKKNQSNIIEHLLKYNYSLSIFIFSD